MKAARIAGFTLAEMLVVIAIMLILAAIIYPVFLGVREIGYASTCVSNLHQLHVAVENYTSVNQRYPPAHSFDYKDVYGIHSHIKGWVSWNACSVEGTTAPLTPIPPATPYSWRTSDNGGLPGSLAEGNVKTGCLWDYTGQELGVYLCPTFAQKKICGCTDAVRSYSMNTNLHWVNLFDVRILPSQWVLFGDEEMGTTAPKKDPVFVVPTPYGTGAGVNELGKFHRHQRGNAVFVDGHVEKLK